MIVEITPGLVFGGIGALVTTGGAAFALGNLQWFRRSEGTELSKAVAELTQTVSFLARLEATVTEQGRQREEADRRIHARLDDQSSKLERLIGACRRSCG